MNNDNVFVGLDIGTTKVGVVVAVEDKLTSQIEVIGNGFSQSDGIKRGVVTHLNRAVESIRKAIEMAQSQSGRTISGVSMGIASDHIKTQYTRGVVTISSPTREIAQADVNRLLDDARKVKIDNDKQILHVIPQDFIIDGAGGVTDPVGMCGIRLEANILIITGSVTNIQNLRICAERAGLHVDDIVLQPIASSLSVLSQAEKELGVALIDIGGGTTDVAVIKDDIVRHTAIFGLAGNSVTDDIASVLRIRSSDAEQVKIEYGHACPDTIMRDETIQIPGVAGRTPTEFSKTLLSQIIEPRIEEIFEFALTEVMNSGIAHQLNAGVIITGGTAQMHGADVVAQRIFRMPVAIGMPGERLSKAGFGPDVCQPRYSTAVGLVHHAISVFRSGQQQSASDNVSKEESTIVQHDVSDLEVRFEGKQQAMKRAPFFTRVKNWLEEL